jgi:Autotransporter beta-domain/Autochaperone Domain Type 1
VGQQRHRRQSQSACVLSPSPGPGPTDSPRLQAQRRALLLAGTALATTLLLGAPFGTSPVQAATVTCAGDVGTGPAPIFRYNYGPIVCVNTEARRGDPAIELVTSVLPALGQSITLTNSGDLATSASSYPGGRAFAIKATTYADGSGISISNSGDVHATATALYTDVTAISASTYGAGSHIVIDNSGDIFADIASPDVRDALGIGAFAFGGANIEIRNSGRIDARSDGIVAINDGGASYVRNSGHLIAGKAGIFTRSYGGAATIVNTGNIESSGSYMAVGIDARTVGYADSPLSITNHGDISARAGKLSYCSCFGFSAFGILGQVYSPASPLTITNTGSVKAAGPYSVGVFATSPAPGSPIVINNAGGTIFGGTAGVYTASYSGTTILNSGDIGASSGLAIAVTYGAVDIFNAGTITGFVLLDDDDRFINRSGGVFEARQTSDFDAYGPGGGNDLFRNEAGGTVHAVNLKGVPTGIINLERFENAGLISMVDGRANDEFVISNTLGGADLDFVASGNSTLAVDAFLGGPGNSASDVFVIDGDVSGVTTVQVNNTSFGPGVFNPTGIRVVTVTGATPNANAFQLDESIDTGFFNYDLFFVPTGSGYWELRSFAGPGAFLLPQLVTAAQDIWHQSSSTWFDRTADLRVLMAGGSASAAYDPGGKDLSAAGPYPLTPAVWARGSGSWLDRDGTQRTTAYGRDYSFDMDRDLETIDFQVGVDMGKRDVLTGGDALVFGLLGGFVHGDLDYDALARAFNFDGGQVGAYATYLNGGLFVDTLLNVHLYSLDTNTLGFPNSLDANTVGLRTDTGYRFGSFSGGPFIEPLATIEVMWADIDGFSLGGNTVSFGDDANVRGRLGLRAGTTTEAWDGTLMEPFVIGSLWGNLTDDNSATLVSTGRTFRFEDQLDDVWGEVSAGVNFFNFSQTTAVFAKVDVTFGDDLTGLGGKAGMRVNW